VNVHSKRTTTNIDPTHSAEVTAQFKAGGVDIKHRLALVDMPDDDDTMADEAVADEGREEEERALAVAEAAIAAARRPRKSNTL